MCFAGLSLNKDAVVDIDVRCTYQTSERREDYPAEPPVAVEETAEAHSHFGDVAQEFVAAVAPGGLAELGDTNQ